MPTEVLSSLAFSSLAKVRASCLDRVLASRFLISKVTCNGVYIVMAISI